MVSKIRQRLAMTVVAIAWMVIAASGPTAVRAVETHAVQISGFAFAPATLTITAGDTVTWTNADPVIHTATSTSGAFDSGDLPQGSSFSFTFATPGTYDYLCTPHPTMTGRVVVLAAPVAPSPSSGAAIPDVAMPSTAPDPLILVGAVLIAAAATVRWKSRPRVG